MACCAIARFACSRSITISTVTGRLFFVPHVIVCDMGHDGKIHLGLARQKGLRAGGHADDVAAPGAKGEALGFGAKARAFDCDERSAVMNGAAARARRHSTTARLRLRLNGSPTDTWPTMPPSKKLAARLPLVGSNNWVGTTMSRGAHLFAQAAARADADAHACTPSDLSA